MHAARSGGTLQPHLQPRHGKTSWRYASVSVVAPTATPPDALSTAFSVMPIEMIRPIVTQLGGHAHLAMPDGQRVELSAA
jgi:thiamine biosynthesis lipoprotein